MLNIYEFSLAEACEISKSIHNQRMEVERFEKSKSLMKSDSTFERYIFQKNGRLYFPRSIYNDC